MLASYAKWYSFTPPQRPNFPPPLTGVVCGMESCGPGVSVGGFNPDLVIQSVERFCFQACSVTP